MRFDEAQLPSELLSFIARKGFTELYPPQEEAIRQGLLEGRSLVIASPTACYDEETEVLTRNGWKQFRDTSPDEEVVSMNPKTFQMEYVKAINKVEQLYTGVMVRIEGKEIDFRVTENHNMFVCRGDERKARNHEAPGPVSRTPAVFEFRPALEIHQNWKFKTDGVWKGTQREYFELPPMEVKGRYPSSQRRRPTIRIPMHAFLNFLGWYMAEGSTKFGGGNYEVTLCQRKDLRAVKQALAKLNIAKVYSTGSDNHRHFSISSPQLARYLSQFGRAYEKFVPDFVRELTPDEIRIFLASYIRGDGHTAKDGTSPIFNTTSKRLADGIQELLLRVGMSSSVTPRGVSTPHVMPDGHVIKPKHQTYEIARRRYSEHGIDYRKPSKPPFEITRGEMVYCLTLPKYHLLYVRRKGKAFWCGNSGKTLIAFMAAFGKVKNEGRKVVYLAPLRALASEKYAEFSELAEFGIKTAISTGDFDTSGESLGRADIIVLTNERFDSIMRQRTSWLRSVGLFIVDEVHLAGNDSRGPTLEMILTKIIHLGLDAQMLSLSATISNAGLIAQWLHSKPVELNWRPVPLRQGVFDYGRILFSDGEERAIATSTYGPPIDVAMDAVRGGGQSLIFASTRRRAVSLATRAAEVTQKFLSDEEKRALSEAGRRILSSGEETSLSKLLAELIVKGVAFHHAGLESEHRRIVEDYYRVRAVKLLAATPTLCLPEGEEIFGNPGPVGIESLVEGSRVLTHGNKFMPVITAVKRTYSGKLLKITPRFQLPMRMTPEHKVLRVTRLRHSVHGKDVNRHWWTYARPEWTESKNLKCGDLVLFPIIKEQQDIDQVELPGIGRLANQTGTVGKHWSRLKTASMSLTVDALETLGLYVAEGYTGRGGQIMFALNQNELELTRKVCEWFESLGLRWNVSDSVRHRRVVRACSKQLAAKLREMFGESAGTKTMPHSFVLLPQRKLTAFVRGMWRGDGNISLGKNRSAKYSTVSRALAKQLFAVLVKLGYMPSIRRTPRAGRMASSALGITRKHDLYTVSVSGRQLPRFVESVLGEKCLAFTGNREYNVGYADSAYFYMPIRKIEQEDYKGTVYNLEVAGHSSYVGSFVVHNSAGVNLPARRVVIADMTRFDVAKGGSSEISVLEYRQMAGRAGRPQYDDYGETVIIPSPSQPAKEMLDHYVNEPPEPIRSMLAGEAAMRMHTLATIATASALSQGEMQGLFSRTLLSRQLGEERVWKLVEGALGYLISQRLVEAGGGRFTATDFGRRVSMLYIDPATGVLFRDAILRIDPGRNNTAGLLHLAAKSPDFEPKFPLRSKDYDQALAFIEEHSGEMIERAKSKSFADYDEVLQEMRTVMVLHGWIDEWREEQLLSRLGAEPGDIHRAVDNADWLLHSLEELCKLFGKAEAGRQVELLRRRVESGVSEELVELTVLQGVGRVRARALFAAGYRTIEDVKEAPADRLALVEKIGTALARRIKEQTSRY